MLRLGTVWAGGSDEGPPEPLDAAVILALAGGLVPLWKAVVNHIHLDVTAPSLPAYSRAWR